MCSGPGAKREENISPTLNLYHGKVSMASWNFLPAANGRLTSAACNSGVAPVVGSRVVRLRHRKLSDLR